MRKFVATMFALLLILGAGAAWAEDVSGKIRSIDQSQRMIVLEDGTELWIAEGLATDTLKDGASVKASYEERDGKKVVTGFQVSD